VGHDVIEHELMFYRMIYSISKHTQFLHFLWLIRTNFTQNLSIAQEISERFQNEMSVYCGNPPD
jgi:hypothetical protein